MAEEKAPIGLIGITPRRGKNISQELDSCNILLKISGIEPLRLEPLIGYGKISVEGSQLDRALQVLVDDGFEVTIFSD